MIRHVVLMKLTDPDDAAETKARLEALTSDIPEIRSLTVGIDVLRTDASYDLSLITTHASTEELQTYLEHPVHQAFRSWVGPRLAARAVVDSVESEDRS